MKNIIIWGVPRSGKSTLAKMIRQKFGHSVIQMDAIKSVYDVIRPEDNISARETTNYDEAKMMAKMVTRLIQCLSWGNDRGEFYVYEGVSFDMDTIVPALPKEKFPVSLDNFIVICMGYAGISPEEKVKEIVRYETARDWTYGESMESKLTHFKTYCDESKFVSKTAERLGLKYFDVSFERDKVFEEIMRYIKQNIC
jgi:adenylate kinase family enzyme